MTHLEDHYPIIVGSFGTLRRDERYRVREESNDDNENFKVYFCDELISSHGSLVIACNAAQVHNTKRINAL